MRIAGRSWGCFANAIFALVCAALQQPYAVAQHDLNDFCVGSPQSAILAARNGGNRAYVEITAERPKPRNGRNPDTACASRSKLFVSTSDDVFALSFMQSPTPERPGTQMKPIDWSPSGQYLLVDLLTFQYEGEGAEHSPLIYDADSWLVYEPDLHRLFKEHFGKDCAANASAEGFTSDGFVLMRVSPLATDTTYEPKTPPSCVKHKGFWSLDFKKGDVKFLGDRYEVKKYGQ